MSHPSVSRPLASAAGRVAALPPLLLVSGDFVQTGGMDRCNYSLARYCAERGREVHLVGFRAAADLAQLQRLRFHRVPKLLGSHALSEPLLDRVGRAWARRIAAAGGRVIVNGGNCRFADVNWVHHIHAADGPFPGGRPWTRLRRRLTYWNDCRRERKTLPQAGCIITSCHRNKEDLVHRLGIREEKVRVAYYGVDANVFRPVTAEQARATRAEWGLPQDRPCLAFIGALGNRRKGFDSLFEAWQRLCAGPGWDAQLVVVGRGAELPLWQARTAAAGLQDRIRFLGFVKNLPALTAACDAHVLPSRYEGYSLVTHEALCCGLPALVTASAGIAERYPPDLRDLLLPDPENVDDLATRLRHWHARRDSFRTAALGFSQFLRQYSWEDMAVQIAGFIDESGPG